MSNLKTEKYDDFVIKKGSGGKYVVVKILKVIKHIGRQ